MASEKQVGYALSLLSKRGYSTTFMAANFGSLGATMRERGGKVEDWLRGMDSHRISKLIATLMNE